MEAHSGLQVTILLYCQPLECFRLPSSACLFLALGGDQGVVLLAAVGCDKGTDEFPVEIGCSVKGDVGRLIPSGSVLGC